MDWGLESLPNFLIAVVAGVASIIMVEIWRRISGWVKIQLQRAYSRFFGVVPIIIRLLVAALVAATVLLIISIFQMQTQIEKLQSQQHANLIAQMYDWRNDPEWREHREHTARWDRALLAFGETISDASLEAMTADDAQGFADRGRGWHRWVPVAKVLRAIEADASAQKRLASD